MDWMSHLAAAKADVSSLAAASPGTVAGYHKLHTAADQQNLLGEKVRELICIAVAITTRCDSCIANHVEKAVALGASRAEIVEAAGVAVAMNAGAALTYASRALNAHTALSKTD